MSWQQPKTDWQAGDVFDLVPDYARITDNLATLRALAEVCRAPCEAAPCASYAETDFADAAFFNGVERAVTALQATAVTPAAYAARRFAANTPVWTADDLNRIESAQATLHKQLQSRALLRPKLALSLRGSEF